MLVPLCNLNIRKFDFFKDPRAKILETFFERPTVLP